MGLLDRFKKQGEAPEKASVAKQVAKKQEEKQKKAPKKDAGKKKPEEAKKAKKAATSATRLSMATLLAPIVTEKSAQQADSGVMAFRVAPDANRVAVKQAFRELYKVTPKRVRIINVRGKHVRFGRVRGRRQDYKKALITLPKGARVDIYEGV